MLRWRYRHRQQLPSPLALHRLSVFRIFLVPTPFQIPEYVHDLERGGGGKSEAHGSGLRLMDSRYP